MVHGSTVAEATIEGFGPGAVFGGRFVIEAIVGSGAAGVVFRARDRQREDALVALKLLRSAADEDRERFSREVRALAAITHPAVVSLIESGLAPSGQPFIAMRWIDGETLAERLERGPLTERETVSLARALLGALAAAHGAGVLHRDVKPANIVLEGRAVDRAVLVDFGLVRAKHDPVRSRAGVPLGTPAYMAPEQIRAESEIDGRADLFSVGCVLFECLCGRRAFAGDDVVEVFVSVLLEPAASLKTLAPSTSPSLVALVERLLDKDPTARPESARDALASIDELHASIARPESARRTRVQRTVEQPVAAPASLAWALFADTDRWDRYCRAPRTEYASHDGADGERVRVGSAVLALQPSRWIESGEGIAAVRLRAARRFIEGAFAEIGYDVDVEAVDERRCVVRCTTYIDDDGHAVEGAAELLASFFEQRLLRFFSAVHELLGALDPALLRPLADESASAHARRVVLAAAFDQRALAGDCAALDEPRWSVVRERWAAAIEQVDPALQTRLAQLVERGADDVVRRIRPGELALAWRIERRDMLRALLAATKLGLLELRWELRCRNCRSSATSRASLAAVGRAVHCAECGIDTAVDLASNVEAVFAVSPSLRRVSAKRFCGASPAFRPHVAAFFTVERRATRELEVPLPSDGVIARVRVGAKSLSLPWAAAPALLVLRADGEGFALDRAEGRGAGSTVVRVHNDSDEPLDVELEHRSDGPMHSAVTVASMPEFARWFGGEAPAQGAELTLSAATVLLVECAEVDALFEREGDVAASAQIERALNAASAQIEATAFGAVLRRTGSGLMALFEREADAERAFEVASSACLQRGAEIAGALYSGPCVMVRRDDRCELLSRGLLRARAALVRDERARLQRFFER